MWGRAEKRGQKSISDLYVSLSGSGGAVRNDQLYDCADSELVLVCGSRKLLRVASSFCGIYQAEKHTEK